NQIVADTARIFGPGGRAVKTFADGLPAAVTFRLPAGAAWFELEVGGERIRQQLVAPPPPLPPRR
ncbi:MAG TPA: hypothetical protein VM597_15345, partial [Gemmataceae bacterium]|nr:hypothetical protein [Gemmataceae bacterium]